MSRLGHYVAVLRQQQHRGRFLASRILWHTGLGRFLRIRRDGYVLRFYPSNLSAQLWLDPAARREDEAFLERYLREGDCFIDVGANIGMLALKAARLVGEAGSVLAFEPSPQIFGYLRGNVRLNGFPNIVIHMAALGSGSGRSVRMQTSKFDDMNQVSRDGDGPEVPLARLDEFGDEMPGEIALLKVDVEGYEKFVFEGAPGVLGRTRCVLFEACAEHFAQYGYVARDVLALLERRGFSIYRCCGERLAGVAENDRVEQLENLLAVRDPAEFSGRTGLRLEEGA